MPSIASARRCSGLLPTHPQYAALKHALELTPKTEVDKVNRIRLNMDRWRWLPRDLGERYIIVNVPAYHRGAGRERRRPSRSHVRSRGRDQDPDAAADGDWRPA